MNNSWFVGWTREENKEFEVALVSVDEATPNRWEVIATMLSGNRTADDVRRHYDSLVKNIELIESGALDHILKYIYTAGDGEDSSESAHQDQQDLK